MMEFTYDGFVRWGFGFHNPNHASAAICAVLPFVWGCGRAGARPSLWVAFAGLTISACMASVFDWHVLFDWDGMGDLDGVNFVLSWILFAAYLVMGILLIVLKRRECCPERDRPSEARHTWRFTLGGILRAVCSGICGACAFVVLLLFVPTVDVPKVRNGFVVKDGASMPLVLHDAEWPLTAVLPYLETDGYRLAIEPGYQEPDVFPGVVWLFGTCAESAHRFTNVAVTIVSPPEFCILPPGTQVIR